MDCEYTCKSDHSEQAFNCLFSNGCSIRWRSNVESLDCNFAKHIARFVGPEHFKSNTYKSPILFIGGNNSDYLT